jgi:hypothetical protein
VWWRSPAEAFGIGPACQLGHLLKFEGKSWRLKEAAERVAKRTATA